MKPNLPVHPKTNKCPKCGSQELEVRYFKPDQVIVSAKVCLDCDYKFYDGTFGEDEMEEKDKIVGGE